MAALEDANDIIRADAFERKYANNWLTGLISRSEEWLELAPDFDETLFAREAVIQLATMLISTCTGTSICGAVTRQFTFGPFLIQVTDDALPSEDHTAVGLNTWGSARILAERMVADPVYFGFAAPLDRGLKVLELGAGTGLLSLLVRRMLEAQVVAQKNDFRSSPESVIEHAVVATDYHPSVLANLGFNLSSNPPSVYVPEPYRVSLACKTLDWRDPPELDEAAKYDVILGADIVYERSHAEWIRSCVEAMLKKPGRDGSAGGVFWLIYPERPTHQQELDSVQEAFFDRAPTPSNDEWILRALDEERIERKRGIGRVDEERYRLWRIGWRQASA
jgi:protein-lysine N-methyltransferase EEF2KMT